MYLYPYLIAFRRRLQGEQEAKKSNILKQIRNKPLA